MPSELQTFHELNDNINKEYFLFLVPRFHTKETESLKRTCALCLGELPEDSPNPKVCAQCSERHNIRQGLCQLMARSEEQKNELLHDCADCDDSFDTRAQLQDHMRVEHPTESSSSPHEALRRFNDEEGKLYGCHSCPQRFQFKADLDEHVDQQHLTQEVIKREREDSADEDNDNGRDDSDAEMSDDNERRVVNKDGDDERHGGSAGGNSPGSVASERDSIVNVESEIKIDNDSYATAFYYR